jgi:hypothetical protein
VQSSSASTTASVSNSGIMIIRDSQGASKLASEGLLTHSLRYVPMSAMCSALVPFCVSCLIVTLIKLISIKLLVGSLFASIKFISIVLVPAAGTSAAR